MLLEHQDSRSVAHLSGRVDVSFVERHGELFRKVIREGRPLTLHLGKVAFLDSSALGLLVTLKKEASGNGVAFQVASVSTKVRVLLELTCLDGLFEVS